VTGLPDLIIGKPVPVRPTDLEWERRAREMQVEALPRVRGIAEKWAGSVAALLGVFGIASFVKGRDDLKGLEHDWEVAVGVSLGIAVASAVVAILFASLAAQGGVSVLDLPTGRRIQEWSAKQIERASWQLAVSRLCSVAAVIFVAVAVGIVWYAPRESVEPGSLRIVLITGESVCGTLGHSQGKMISVIPTAGSPRVINLRDVLSIETGLCE
jgi:hypothetical protein